MKRYFARSTLALLWYAVFVAIAFSAGANPDLDSACSRDIGVVGLLLMAYMMASSVGLALYAVWASFFWLVMAATASPGGGNADR